MKNTNLLNKYKFYKSQKEMLDASALCDNPFYFKHGNTKFAFAKNFDDFFNVYKNNLGLSIYELIPFQGKLPLYLDIEYYANKINEYDARERPLIFDGSKTLHWVKATKGNKTRYSLVFFNN